jgi:hypothetical protein
LPFCFEPRFVSGTLEPVYWYMEPVEPNFAIRKKVDKDLPD